MTQSPIPATDSAALNSKHRFHVDGTNQHLLDALRYLENIAEFDEVPKSKRQLNELQFWIDAFKWSYERIPHDQKI